ncbi:MAG TPA: ATP-binding cassette domain-containing protein [Acidimicrobiales bacterium]|jgi:ABC-type lipoprotein export system ATPase subunit
MTIETDLVSTSGVDVHVRGVIHLYPQEGADVVALRGVDLDIEAGEMLALLGPSGMGKSTLLHLLAGLLQPSAGEIRIGEVLLSDLTPAGLRQLRASEVSFVLQDTARNLLPYATVAENVWFAQQGDRRPERRDVHELLGLLGLGDLAQRKVRGLPLGLQQQVALVAAVAITPRLLLADEPTNQLDTAATEEVIELLRAINQRLGTTVVLVTHDPLVAGALPRTVTIRDGRVGAEGRRGVQYAVLDASGSIQLPPEVREQFPPMSRFAVEHDGDVITLRPDVEGGEP